MKLLAFDTSTEYLSVALWVDGVVTHRDELANQSHSTWLLPWIEQMLADAGVSLTQLDAIAFGNGPGGFTGLRIGAGVAHGLALGAAKPLLPINSLLTLAQEVGGGNVIACLDARMQQVYLAAYRFHEGEWVEVLAPGLYDHDALPELPGGEWTGLGSGFDHFPAVAQFYQSQLIQVLSNRFPHAQYLAALAARGFAQGQAVPPGEADLLYVRDKVAQTIAERQRP